LLRICPVLISTSTFLPSSSHTSLRPSLSRIEKFLPFPENRTSCLFSSFPKKARLFPDKETAASLQLRLSAPERTGALPSMERETIPFFHVSGRLEATEPSSSKTA